MAGDWIKMRVDLFTHPKVVRMASALKADVLRTVGGLMSVWCLFDAHSEDGWLDGYTSETLDDHLRFPGFAAAMMAVNWLAHGAAGGLVLPEFSTHNGQSAKRRAQDADRKRDVRKTSASQADKKRTREEKRREELPVGELEASVQGTERAGDAQGARLDAGEGGGPGAMSDAQASTAVEACLWLRKLGMRVQPAMPPLLALVAAGATVEQLALTAAELALRKLGWLGDPSMHPELLERFASGASAEQMGLTAAQHNELRNAAPNIGYLAATLEGRAKDAMRGGFDGTAFDRAGAPAAGSRGRESATERAERKRRAGDARDDELGEGVDDVAFG